jgi:uncharacterized protein YbgA (DUF1722 family)
VTVGEFHPRDLLVRMQGMDESADRVRELFAGPWTPADLVRFHAAEKLVLMAHDPQGARRLGQLVAGQRELAPEVVARRYRQLHAAALARPATPGRRANALTHLAGHLKRALGSAERRELHRAIERYRQGRGPFALPQGLLARHLGELER